MSKKTSSRDEPVTDAAASHSRLSVEEIFYLLSNSTRLSVAALLARRERSISFDELLANLTTKTDARRREQVSIELRHRHLPMLSEAGIVEYESRNEIARGPAFARIGPVLEVVRTEYSE